MQENNKPFDENEDEAVDNDGLLQYLTGGLDKDELHEFEKQMADSPFVDDAVEGLQAFKTKEHIQNYAAELNRQLQKQLQAKKSRREKRKLKSNSVTIIAIVVILVLCVLAYFVIHHYKK